MQVNIKNLIDDTQCYDTVRELSGQKEECVRFVNPRGLSERIR
jgi:hypothetical protein